MSRTIKGLTALFAVAALSVVVATSAFATRAPHVKVDVCHATGSQSNPYVSINVNVNSVGVANDLNGHAGHVGDIWAPFVFNGVTYPGQGDQSILAAGCKLPGGGDDTPPVIAPAASLAGGACTVPTVTAVFDNSASVDGTDGDKDDNPSAAVTFTVLVDGTLVDDYSATVQAGETASVDVTGLADGDVVTVIADDQTLASLTVALSDCGGNPPGNPDPPKHHKCASNDAKCKAAKAPDGASNQQLIEDSGTRVQGG